MFGAAGAATSPRRARISSRGMLERARLQGLYREHHGSLRRPDDRRHEPDRADRHHVEDREGGGREPHQGGARRRRARRLSRRHVRRFPRQRRLSVHVRRPMGRPPRRGHRLSRRHLPTRDPDHRRDCRASPIAPSNITCTSIPPTKCWRRRPSPASTRRGSRASRCRWSGSASTAQGRVFYSSLGHVTAGFAVPEMRHHPGARAALGGALRLFNGPLKRAATKHEGDRPQDRLVFHGSLPTADKPHAPPRLRNALWLCAKNFQLDEKISLMHGELPVWAGLSPR